MNNHSSEAKKNSEKIPPYSLYSSTSTLPHPGVQGFAASGVLLNPPSEKSAKNRLETYSSAANMLSQQNIQPEPSVSLSESVESPSGKLYVKIAEAQGLSVYSTSSKPYVVCTFQSAESIISPTPNSSDPISSQNNDSIPSFSSSSDNSINNQTRSISIAIPKSRTTSSNTIKPQRSSRVIGRIDPSKTGNLNGSNPENPLWQHEAAFDVVGNASNVEISLYDANENDRFLGQITIQPRLTKQYSAAHHQQKWYKLMPRVDGDVVSGRILVSVIYEPISKSHYGPDDFEILRLVGKGTFGKVFQVRKKDTQRIYAMKMLSKKVIVQKKEIAHTIGERNILVRTTATESPFIVGLKFSFQTPTDLYFITDYMSGGELFWHLQREGRFHEERAKFYIAELILALEHLHNNDIVYRDLKPENILLDANGHITLCDFGLSKANLSSNMTTNTFCGTTEYLAPEVLLDEQGYTKMVDFWSLGVLIFEMCCGWSPFYADDTQQMYKNIAFGKVRFPKDALSSSGRSLVKGLLNRNPSHRLGARGDAAELKAHPFFDDIDWQALLQKKIPPPFKPHVTSETDTSNFDPEFTNASTSALRNGTGVGLGFPASTPLSPTLQAKFQGFTFVGESSIDDHFRGRNSLGTSLVNRMDIEFEDDDDEDEEYAYEENISGNGNAHNNTNEAHSNNVIFSTTNNIKTNKDGNDIYANEFNDFDMIESMGTSAQAGESSYLKALDRPFLVPGGNTSSSETTATSTKIISDKNPSLLYSQTGSSAARTLDGKVSTSNLSRKGNGSCSAGVSGNNSNTANKKSKFNNYNDDDGMVGGFFDDDDADLSGNNNSSLSLNHHMNSGESSRSLTDKNITRNSQINDDDDHFMHSQIFEI